MIGLRSLGIVACFAATAALADTAPTDVKIVDGTLATPLTETPGDAVRGRDTFAGRKLGNCLACHENSEMKGELQFHGEVGPPLDGVADRWSEAELRAIVVNSKAVFGDHTIMPAFYRTTGFNRTLEKFAGKTILSAQQVEDVVAYLKTLKE
ncbi:MAG: sulfur oxidation c-type cytochrome SoxX [Pseudomonadota bacterium]